MKPILFNTKMVRAILEGRKTVTRRVVKPQPEITPIPTFGGSYRVSMKKNLFIKPPYHPGDTLYARETFQIDYLSNIPGTGRIRYKADDTYSDFNFAPERYDMMRRAQLKPGWRPNENMPREAARIFLRVTDVRVERLQSITEAEAEKEGLRYYDDICQDESWTPTFYDPDSGGDPSTVAGFSRLWDSTIKPADRALYGWDASPWVWVISFERCEKPKEDT